MSPPQHTPQSPTGRGWGSQGRDPLPGVQPVPADRGSLPAGAGEAPAAGDAPVGAPQRWEPRGSGQDPAGAVGASCTQGQAGPPAAGRAPVTGTSTGHRHHRLCPAPAGTEVQTGRATLAVPQPLLLAVCSASYLIQTQLHMHFSGNKLLLDTGCDCFFKTVRGGSVPSSTDKVSGDRGISIHHINLQLILRNQYFSLRTCESWAIIGKNLFRLTP